MDAATSIVETYLHANGYFTVTEYPIVEELEGGGYRAVTDVDVLAVRLPGAGRVVPRQRARTGSVDRLIDPDPLLIDETSDTMIDIVIAEVKEGVAELNKGARSPATIVTALRRFALIEPDEARHLVDELLEDGTAVIPGQKVRIRLFAFGSRSDERHRGNYHVIHLCQCLDYLYRITDQFQGLSGAAQIRNPAANFLSVLRKSGFLRGFSGKA